MQKTRLCKLGLNWGFLVESLYNKRGLTILLRLQVPSPQPKNAEHRGCTAFFICFVFATGLEGGSRFARATRFALRGLNNG